MAAPTASIALNRFGLGARPGDAPPADPRRWLLDQMEHFDAKPAMIAAAPGSATIAAQLGVYFEQQRQLRQQFRPRVLPKPPTTGMPAPPIDSTKAGTTQAGMAVRPPPIDGSGMQAGAPAPMPPPPVMAGAGGSSAGVMPPPMPGDPVTLARQFADRQARDDYTGLVGARATAALVSDTPFAERLVHFWANHFAVSADKLEVIGLSGTLEMEAIRPNVFGKFSDMLFAVERHPAMLLYLDQAVSVGPNSPLGARVGARGNRRIGLNENLAREIMELHTLGVRTGYTQADVTEFARAMTGWTVAGIANGPGAKAVGLDGPPGSFFFASAIHEPGARTIMGKAYAEPGFEQAASVLSDLSVHPATAQHLCFKLARHFAGDVPPAGMVRRLRAAYLRSGGDLPTVYRAIIDSPEAWVASPVKFKTPWEWSLSTMRALGMNQIGPLVIVGLMNQLGQPIWKPGQPIGYDDIAASWAGPDAVMRRVEAADRFATRQSAGIDARALAPKLFPSAVSPATQAALARAESPGQALALLLVAPEMMRR